MRVEEHLQRWVEGGVITREHADRIREHERSETAGSALPARVAEAVGYVGGALALVALLVLVEDFWEDLEIWSQVALLGVLSALLLAAGAWTGARDDAAPRRLGSVLWFLSVAAFAFAGAVAVGDGLELEDSSGAAAVSALTAVYAGVLWRRRPHALQQLALGAAVLTALVTTLAIRGGLVEEPFVALAVWALGVVWALLTWGELMLPRRTGYALGTIAALAGAQGAAFTDFAAWGYVLGLATAAAAIAASVVVGELVLLGIGSVGAFVFVAETVFEFFGDTVGVPVALFLVGVALVGIAVLLARLRPHVVEADDVVA